MIANAGLRTPIGLGKNDAYLLGLEVLDDARPSTLGANGGASTALRVTGRSGRGAQRVTVHAQEAP